MVRNKPRKEFKLSLLQLIVVAAFWVGGVIAAYLVGVKAGAMGAYESARKSDLGAAAKIPISAPVAKEDRLPSVSDVYSKLDGNAPLGTAATPATKSTGAPELSAIPKVDIAPRQRDLEDLDNEIAETLVKPEEVAPSRRKPAADDVWGSRPPNEGAALHEKTNSLTLGGIKEEDADEVRMSPTETPARVKEPSPTPIPISEEKVKSKTPTATPTPRVEEKKKEKEEMAEEPKAAPRGWFAQVASAQKLKDAQAIAGQLKQSGFPAIIETARVRGVNYYRVLVGPETSQEHANRLLGQLKRETYLATEGEPFVKMVK